MQTISKSSCRVFAMGCVTLIQPLAARADIVDDSKVTLGLRNAYIDRDFKQSDAPKSRVGSWSQGFDLRFISGYTDGVVQFGLDASAQWAYRLDGGGGRGPDTVLPYDAGRQEQVREYGRSSVTGKIRVSRTELKIGELRPTLPVAYIDDSRQLITTYQGAMLESKEWEGLTLTGGRITQIAARDSSDHEKIYLMNGPDIKHRSDGLSFAGATYQLAAGLSGTYFYGQLEDVYKQHYFGLTDVLGLGDGYTLKTDIRYYRNSETGEALYGKIDNRTYGAMTTLSTSGHSFGLGYQRMLGESAFPLFNGYAPQPYLVNWSTLGFFKLNESSWQLRYDYDFAAIGIPGLKAMARYMRGTGIDRGTALPSNVESESNLVFSYVIQSGPFKNLGFEWRHIDVKTRFGSGSLAGADYDENRLITTYTYRF
ncbi:OprD family porin [Pseudomonas silvicola]|nr:OprD family porin [Pseudomonas silvicola]